jgi:hypothetical protein
LADFGKLCGDVPDSGREIAVSHTLLKISG